MSLALHDLQVCCRGLENDKATERRKEADRFRRLLRTPEIVQELDRISALSTDKGSKQLTWDAVFRFLQSYVQKETEKMQSRKATVTASTLAARQTKMAEICCLIKYFIRCANKRGPRLKCARLLQHVMEVLQSSYSCLAYGEQYTSLLVKDILSVRKYWCDITPQQWHSLLELYCGFFSTSSKSINRVLVSRVIHMLVQGCCMQTEGFHNFLFSFFSKALLNVRQEKHLAVVERLISALNGFLRSAAMNFRTRVCRLGEELLPSILYVWADMRPSTTLKEEMVDFFNLQLCVHHPSGAKTQDAGAYAEDWTKWRSLLYNLYDALVREISHIGSRGKYVTGTRHIAVKDNLIQLTADICHQVRNDTQVLEVTQVHIRATQRGSPTQGTPSKRRRIELGWEVLRDRLQPQHIHFTSRLGSKYWLQITTVLTSKYPSMVPGQELVTLLSVLYQLLAEQRRGERGLYVLCCLRAVARCQACYPERTLAHRAELGRLWGRVWALALRGVSASNTEAASLSLLASIVQGGLIATDREFWKLFCGSACRPSQSAALCLTQALLKCPVPKSLVLGSGWDCAGVSEGSASSNLKETLIAWLLMTDQSDEMEDSSRPHPIICRLSESTSPECLVRCLSLLTGVLAGYVSTGVLTEVEACRSQLFTKAKVHTHIQRLQLIPVCLLRSYFFLMGLFCYRDIVKDNACPASSALFMMILPSSLLSELAEICKLLVSDRHIYLWPESDLHILHPCLLTEEHLAHQDLALLAVLEFLCECSCVQPTHGLLFKPQEVRRRLLQLLDQMDVSRALHLNMYLVLLKKLPAEDSLFPEEFDSLLRPLADLCSLYRQDQEICAAVLPANQSLFLHKQSIVLLHTVTLNYNVAVLCVNQFLTYIVLCCSFLAQTGKCTASVRAALVRCLVALLEADPCCKWAVLYLKEEERPVSAILPSHLADTHHQVRMLVAMSVERLFVEMSPDQPDKRKMLPLKHQQKAFENIYLKAQEGMRLPDLQDETLNRKATLLKSVSVVLCCSPVCEKQSLFALFQSFKENNIEEQLMKKMLCSVSRALGYKSVKTFVSSHLDYLVAEWLGQRESDELYTLQSFPYTLLNHETLEDFYSSSYQVLIPHLVFLDDFEQVKSIGSHLEKDWRELLADCFPKIMVNILPYFALSGQDAQVAQQRETAHKVYDLLKDANCLGKQQIDSLIHSNLPDIVVELLMTLYEGAGPEGERGDLRRFIGELDPAPNPPYFSSYVIKATLDYLSKCHSANHKSLVAILSKTPISIQRILLAVCERAAETTNSYERHRILLMYHLFVSLLLRELKDGLGGAWAFVLRDIIYTLIHHIDSRSEHCDEVSSRSLALCCDLLTEVCRAVLQFCDGALDSHLQVIIGSLTAQVLSLLQFLVIENQQKLKGAICSLEPFPDRPEFRELRSVQHNLKYSTGTFTLQQEITHFLSVTSCDYLPLTRLEGLKQLTRQLHDNKGQIRELLKESHGTAVLVKLVLSLLQLCKLAANHPGGADILEAVGGCLGELGPIDFSTIALLHGRDPLYAKSESLFTSTEAQCLYIILDCMNNAIEVRKAAAQCVKNILATQMGLDFWEQHKDNRDPMLAYLNPFRRTKEKPHFKKHSEARERLERQEFWIPQRGGHDTWLTALCTALLDSGGVRNEALLLSRPLCLVSVDFCQRLLPLIIHSILLEDSDGSWRELLSSHIQEFFTFCSRSAQASSRSATPLTTDSGESDAASRGLVEKASLRTMLSVIDYLRHQRRPNSCGTVCHSNFWLELNYLEVAVAAQSCSAHFTALLYSEIYVDKIKANMEEASRRINFEENSQNVTISSLTEKSMEDTSISLQELLIEVYRSIGEPDSLYGCGGETMTSPLTRIRTYEHEAMWGKALTSYDLHSTLPEVTRQVGIVEGLQNFGLSSILATYLRGLESEGVEWGAELRELRFQAAWRNCQWDCEMSERWGGGFNESVFSALQALRDKEFSAFDQTLKYARGAEVEELCRGSLEAVSSLYPALRNLQSIRELESVRQLFSRPLSDVTLMEVCRQWRQHSQLLADSDFALVEPILAVRSVLCRLALCTDRCVTLLPSRPLHPPCVQLAERAVFQMKQHGGRGARASSSVSSWQLEEAQVFWAKGEQGLALGLLRQMIHTLEEQVEFNPALAPVYTECLRLCGNWLAETCLESPGVILENYLERAVEVIVGESGLQDPRLQSQQTEAFLSLARFSDAQYQSIDNYMKSSEFENKQALLEKAKEEVDLMKERKVSTNRYTIKVQKELELDQRALSSLQADRLRFLCKAVENYIQCLKQGEEHDTWVFRLASLWLENADVKAINDKMKVGIRQIPSYKFLPLMYQLAARMGTKKAPGVAEDAGFHGALTDLICRSSLEHPHHTLFIILALVNANKDESFSTSRLSKSTPRQPSPLDLERADVAKKIISVIKKKRGEMVRGIERLCDAYITLAYMDVSRHKTEKKALPIPADQPIMQIKDLEEVVIPTMEIKVDPSGSYDNLVTVRNFMPHYHLAGGVNLPKIIDCVGSDGKSRRQLVKGKDDLRQDAVMQQVFGMCSTLLQRNTDTRKRNLNIRRYKVVPFSQCSGVLEWCSGTVPIGEFLVDPHKGAHIRFRAQDWTNMTCRKKMMEAQRLGFDEKIQVYNEVCKNFRPVFRYFCMERFLDPAVWMEKRLAYTRSVATSSIVGYIVGLGDRHIQNILIDEQTAELVHIDLGVAFEQGKILPTPETVPFRLSRDIVDGMGITGVEGVFRRCCEKTMEVMRSSQEALLTIVEVLLYDPLFDWTMSPLKAFYLQHDEQQELNATLNSTLGGDDIDNHRKASDSQSFNKVAERVLLRLQEKLKGVEEGTVLSVGGQVNLLIQQAMDPNNLSRLFSGWQAWV
uniref:non-specific serine/threonine protein kinase n=1 Tax=Myripristis murdjan TaxID=586833 RepID=A0A667Z4W4_9TELE